MKDKNKTIASIIYQADDFVFPFLFGNDKKGVNNIAKLVNLDSNSFSHKYIQTHTKNDEVLGIVNFYPPKEINKTLENKDFQQAFPHFQGILLGIKSLLFLRILNTSEIDGMYIQTLAVDKSSRGKGIGTKLLNNAIESAKENGYESIWLDVEIKNKRAKKLYKKFGFKEVSKKRIFPFVNLGVYRMKKELK